LPEGPIGVQANFNGIWIRQGCQKDLSEILPQLGELPFVRPIPVHAAVLSGVAMRCKKKKRNYFSFFTSCLFRTAAVDATFCDYAEVNVATQDLCA